MLLGFTRRQIIAFAVTVALLGAAVTVAWLLQTRQERLDGVYRFTVVRAGEELASYDLTSLGRLPTREVRVDGKLEAGPTLLDVLEASGVDTFSRVIVHGAGLRDDGIITLTRAQIDQDVLLDIANRGTVKVVGPGIQWEDRVRDVAWIEVE